MFFSKFKMLDAWGSTIKRCLMSVIKYLSKKSAQQFRGENLIMFKQVTWFFINWRGEGKSSPDLNVDFQKNQHWDHNR